ncbi:uncharacterized protein PHALS_03919 [Plasmopara halstedii]|uniref:Uncharacterized protein n=1 Tax=Plasmopara halstedii TaxID=4781 RepID=A0A0P1AZW0_PLAHL|nr:uncharacterized protein PHALS_03919 [Plasmopara halstedii]CEG47273.1 hypothetical protein PHALS_03919 [Plasmopara halstedii]|eukprot:XP_024583642.1 hypothetical protein PHALS_03919 [Plasmopara halstedii]
MVATSTSKSSTDVGLTTAAARNSDKCRYKTGKCLNPRSSKRNGQPHQLCLFHRDKANMIQRRFDRQKRQIARTQKLCESQGHESPTSISMLDWSALAELVPPTESMCSTSFSSLKSEDIQTFSSKSSDCSHNESIWTDLCDTKSVHFDEYLDMQFSLNCYPNYLSTDEIDFLCAAVLE